MVGPIMHKLRDAVVRASAHRPFKPIEQPENRVVVVRPDHFGDLLMLSPALKRLREEATQHEIVLMVGPWNKSVAQHLSPDCRLITWPFPGFDREVPDRGMLDPYRDIGHAAGEIREIQPEAIMLMRDDHWWGALMAREAGVPIRTGYDHPQVAPFLTHPMSIPHTHYASQNLDIVKRTLALLQYQISDQDPSEPEMTLNWPLHAEARQEASKVIEQHNLASGFVIVHPGTGAAVKRWPLQRWARVIDQIGRQTGRTIALTGSPDERSLCDGIASSARTSPVNLAGETSLFTLAEVFRQADLVLGVDSGPLHLATATGAPSVHLYGPSDQVRYGPYGSQDRHRVITAAMTCPECGNLSASRPEGCGCMTAITTDSVASVVVEMLADVQ